MSAHPFIFGARNTVTAVPVAIRHAYDAPSYTFWVGYGSDTDTDQDDITIKKGVTDPVTGLVAETTAVGPSNEFEGTLLPWSPAFAQALANAQRDLQLPSILSAITQP